MSNPFTVPHCLDECCDYFTKQGRLHHHALLFPGQVHFPIPVGRVVISTDKVIDSSLGWVLKSFIKPSPCSLFFYPAPMLQSVVGPVREFTGVWTAVGVTCKVLSFMCEEKYMCLSGNLTPNFKKRAK